MTQAELGEIRSRCRAATPGPWKAFVEDRDHTSGSSFIQTAQDDIELSHSATTADYDFIANARQDVERLVAEIERLRSLLGAEG